MSVHFTNNSARVKGALDDAVIAYLYGAGGELEGQVKQNTKRGTGQLANSWTYKVDEREGVCAVGSPLENAIWEEFGTGEFALHGDGRKGGWVYRDDDGKWHHTYGKKPHRAFQSAFNSLKNALIRRAEEVLKGRMQ
ncbi:MAG: HK97 gp10 family phage protein [Roseburia sp.]|nr:HK97 gp10 family phage protein [Roseburia sp.]MBQ8279551.1 HK97 gp10 family phage protein [Roseburia sp.]